MMFLTRNKWCLILSCLIGGIGFGNSNALANESSKFAVDVKQLDVCKNEKHRLNRLTCFDKLLQTPTDVVSPVVTPVALPIVEPRKTGTARVAEQMIELQQGKAIEWLTRFRLPSHKNLTTFEAIAPDGGDLSSIYEENSPDVFMLLQETPSAEARGKEHAALLISCDSNITTLHLVLPKPAPSDRVKAIFQSENGVLSTTVMQTDLDDSILLAGRGLESIDIIKTILFEPRILVRFDGGDQENILIFQTENLGERINHLRSSCHW